MVPAAPMRRMDPRISTASCTTEGIHSFEDITSQCAIREEAKGIIRAGIGHGQTEHIRDAEMKVSEATKVYIHSEENQKTNTLALAYIQNETRRFKTFVANRVTVIRQVSEANQWHHVSGEENPADVLSRGCFVDNLPVSWFNGPPFLSNYKCAWPAQDDLVGHLEDGDPEVRRDVHPTSIVQTCQSGVTQHPIDTLIEHYSSFYRLKKAVGWWLRLIKFLKKTKIPQSSPLEIHELKHAENLIVKHVQGRAYFHETKNIEAGKTVLKSSSIYKLSPILIDGLLVVGGRLKHAILNEQAINPVILPLNHRLSTLIVQDCHNSSRVGVEWTLSQVRKKFWIIRGRKLVKRVKMDCMVCKRLYGAPMNQRMSDLPPERVRGSRPVWTLPC
ncbi:uncharacterized protein LOC143038164 [Oratosquilla oratoria]|uniref:uncharacterized protein LOC143038164 n=1 Tax=Oratosquilla oratoria TaxID=337810 RepID=UPI003F77527A